MAPYWPGLSFMVIDQIKFWIETMFNSEFQKWKGNSVSAIMEGNVKLILLNRGEEYVISMPYANCKGILIGKLTMELGGKVNIECVKTGYSAEIEFKLKVTLLFWQY